MKYRTVKIGEVIPRNAEFKYADNRQWTPYWDDEYEYKEGTTNEIFTDCICVPI